MLNLRFVFLLGNHPSPCCLVLVTAPPIRNIFCLWSVPRVPLLSIRSSFIYVDAGQISFSLECEGGGRPSRAALCAVSSQHHRDPLHFRATTPYLAGVTLEDGRRARLSAFRGLSHVPFERSSAASSKFRCHDRNYWCLDSQRYVDTSGNGC